MKIGANRLDHVLVSISSMRTLEIVKGVGDACPALTRAFRVDGMMVLLDRGGEVVKRCSWEW